ncbi:MAG TPA: sodium/proton-translocating pyrophosphatase, partial [Tepidisphaeraceae bacterium]|nr:sodium/proton-translocating pyrophosphatase [Tepidisphaeraceae bacterium]
MPAATVMRAESNRPPRVLGKRLISFILLAMFALLALPSATFASEADLRIPDLNSVQFMGVGGHTLLTGGLIIAALGMVFGVISYVQLKNLPVHHTMKAVSDLIYETCKTYLITQGKFIMLLWVFIAVVLGVYFGVLTEHTVVDANGVSKVEKGLPAFSLFMILLFSLVGIAGSSSVAWF